MVAADPADKAVAVLHHQRLQQLGVDARREAAAERSPDSSCRNSAHALSGTRLLSFDATSAIVSATPRLVPIDCAIS